jgi:cyclic beta-1,2-glucan synthetase
MAGLHRFHGHFYNWYDTRDLRPLEPRYVSSVDSGNLAAHLITVANATREWTDVPVMPNECAAGARDALHLAREALQALPAHLRTQSVMWQQLQEQLDVIAIALRDIETSRGDISSRLKDLAPHAATLADIARTLAGESGDDSYGDLLFWADATHRSIESWRRDVMQAHDSASALKAEGALLQWGHRREMATSMEFGFLLDSQRRLLSIGYRAADGTLDPSCYDLLASEARLASFIAIAKGDVATRHWFRLGRPVTSVGHGAALISWSGSMFEYLMPSLVMRALHRELAGATSRLIVQRQMTYGAMLGLPWASRSRLHNARDSAHHQYSNFGVPGSVSSED